MDCSSPGSSVHGISQARRVEWVAFPTPGSLPDPGIESTFVAAPILPDRFFTTEPPGKPMEPISPLLYFDATLDSQNSKLNQVILRVNGFSSVQFSPSVESDSLWPHGLQHTRLPCPSWTPGVYSSSCSLSQWCHPTISSSDVPFSSRLQSFPASASFQMTQLFTLGSQSIGVSVSTSVLPKNVRNWFPLGWIGWISLKSKGLSRVFSNTTVQKHQFFAAQLFL